MKKNTNLEEFARTINDLDDGLPKSRGRCFDIGIWGGCGPNCAAFLDGECDEPQEMSVEDILNEYGEESQEVFELYECFKKFILPVE